MPIPLLVYAILVFAISWGTANALLIPQPIGKIPYNRFSRYMPWGELVALGIHNWRTGGVFDWLSQQCLDHRSSLIQLFIPPFSTTRPILVLADLPEIYDITTRRIAEVDRADMMHTWFGFIAPKATIGLKSGDRAFKEGRRLWNSILSPKFLKEVAIERFYDATVDLSNVWEEKAKVAGMDHAFEAQEDLKMATLDGIWKMCVGTNLGLLKSQMKSVGRSEGVKKSNGKAVFVKDTLPGFYAVLGTLLACLDWVMQGISPRFYSWVFNSTGPFGHAMKEKDILLGECITSARSRINTKPEKITNTESQQWCVLDVVLRKDLDLRHLSSGGTQAAATDSALRDELIELLITGHETTASSIAWALKYLTDSPAAQHHLRECLYKTLPDASSEAMPSAGEIMAANLPFLDAVIAETLRCSATGPVSFRQTISSCEILGHAIPAGTPLILVTAGPSYDLLDMTSPARADVPKCGRASTLLRTKLSSKTSCAYNSARFMPERWVRNGSFDSEAVPMLPFSAGSRGCFGKKIAMLEMRIIIALLVMRFEFMPLKQDLRGYAAKDSLTRRPICCYICPKPVHVPSNC